MMGIGLPPLEDDLQTNKACQISHAACWPLSSQCGPNHQMPAVKSPSSKLMTRLQPRAQRTERLLICLSGILGIPPQEGKGADPSSRLQIGRLEEAGTVMSKITEIVQLALPPALIGTAVRQACPGDYFSEYGRQT